jgi:L-ascorbate metabolism protein UlaG (beta-lactamase superfamily)
MRYLRRDVVIEPLWNDWHAWTYLIPPLTAAVVTEHHHLRLLESFLADPERHARAAADPRSLGAQVVALSPGRVDEVRDLVQRTKRELAEALEAARAWRVLDRVLSTEPNGTSLEPLYADLPSALRGLVELVYDRRNVAAAKPLEGVVYEALHRPALESIELSLASSPRAFAFSTPRLPRSGAVRTKLAFASDAIDRLALARVAPCDLASLGDALGVDDGERSSFESFFTDAPPQTRPRFDGDGVRVRYFGHACVLLETRDAAVLVDPWIGYADRHESFSFEDLPLHIDAVVVTHAHADHFVLETLLQLRHRVGKIIVPRAGWGLLDPSLAKILRRCGFAHDSIEEVADLDEVALPGGGSVLSMPFLGEHADLAIRAKLTFRVRLAGHGFFFAADANNIEPAVYERCRRALGPIDVVFIGMECVGAPLDWLYGDMLAVKPTREMSESRRLDGSDARKASSLVDTLAPRSAAFVYALGQEPWLTWLSAVRYDDLAPPIVESTLFIRACEEKSLHAERLFGNREFTIE